MPQPFRGERISLASEVPRRQRTGKLPENKNSAIKSSLTTAAIKTVRDVLEIVLGLAKDFVRKMGFIPRFSTTNGSYPGN